MKLACQQGPSFPVETTGKIRFVSEGEGTVSEWQGRLFRNSYTRAGRRFQLKGWVVKIQHQGQRRTFSLQNETKAAAALEAKMIYENIRAKGWAATLTGYPRRTESDRQDLAEQDWERRLLVRRYHFPAVAGSEQNLAVRIDHDGVEFWFPLGTSELQVAAAKARGIHQTIVSDGWAAAKQRFSRELIVGFEWCANPILWTYTTIHTWVEEMGLVPVPTVASARRVLVVETDAGIRRALQWCVNQQAGFVCVPCASPETLPHLIEQHKPCLVLVNRRLAEGAGLKSSEQLTAGQRGVHVLAFSIVADGDHLFASTPGGAAGYMLKRVKPDRLLDPLVSAPNPLDFSIADLLPRVRMFFKDLLLPRTDQAVSALARLTRREHEVLGLLSKGCVDKEIAEALGISAWTVHGHIKSIFERLGVRTRTEAVVRYLGS
jgi:DNA-binding NarL/FixJ family response regulator